MKIKLLFAFVAIVSISCSTNDDAASYPEKIFEGDIVLNSQIEVNDFGNEHYTKITGSLKIIGSPNFEYINDLSPLQSISNIMGDLQIQDNPGLSGLNLQNVKTIAGNLQIVNNDALINLQGLNNLTSLGSYIKIESNDELINLEGISLINTISSIYIRLNNSLVDIDGLNNISSINMDIEIFNNPLLGNVDGLSNAVAIHLENLKIHGNQMLQNLNGLNKVKGVDYLYISGNPELSNLHGLENVTTVGTIGQGTASPKLVVWNSNSLLSLEGLNNIGYVGGSIEIQNNPQLNNFCAIQTLLSDGEVYGNLYVTNNAFNPSEQSIINGNCSQ